MKIPVVVAVLPLLAFGQNAEKPRFLAADVRESVKSQTQGRRPPTTRGDRYELKNYTMVDLINAAYGMDATRILGGPSWLEMDRFDVIGKLPPKTEPDQQNLMLRSLLADRFKLVIREDTKALPAYALTAGKKPQLKEADGSGDTGCKPQSSANAAGEGILRIAIASQDGKPLQLTLANGMIEYKCRNMTMAAFADGMRGLLAANLGVSPIQDLTGLSGSWNFDFRYSLGLIGIGGVAAEHITIFDAVEKQLGLKLEEKQIPTAVLVVDSVSQKPSENPPGTAEALPPLVIPAAFEVASVKPTNPDSKGGRYQVSPGGRLNAEGLPLRFLLTRAFNTTITDQLTGIPSWADGARFDVIAKAPADSMIQSAQDQEALAPMLLALLKERFKLSYHTEQRDTQGYAMLAVKPKMKKADPASRAWCKNPAQIPGAPPAPSGSQALICQNITMAQFADALRGRAQNMDSPILDSTGLEGGWDFTLIFNPIASLNLGPARPAETVAVGDPGANASDPSGGYSIFEALEKQLGLKLEKQKRSMSVIVIDHIEQTPTED